MPVAGTKGLTVIAAVADVPPASRTVTVTAVSADTGVAIKGMVVDAACVIGNTAELLENAWKGAVPPVIVNEAGTPNK